MSVFQEICHKVLLDIEKLPAHTRLPSRPLLCERYYVSRNTMDRVIESLCRDGHLYTVKSSGTYVADPALPISVTKQSPGRQIAVILPTQGINSSVLIHQGIRDRAEAASANVTFCTSDHSEQKQLSLVRRLLNEGVTGMIIQPPYFQAPYNDISMLLKEKRVPVVFLFNRFPGMRAMPVVLYNEVVGSMERVQHLRDCGYRHIACVSNHGDATLAGGGQFKTYLAAKKLFGLDHNPGHVLIYDSAPTEQFRQGISDMLAMADRPDAFYCFNDTAAGIVYQALAKAGLSVSDDVGVIGSDNSLVCDSLVPPLTSMDIQAYQMGHTAMALLHAFTDVARPPQLYTLLEPRLHIRNSCLGPRS